MPKAKRNRLPYSLDKVMTYRVKVNEKERFVRQCSRCPLTYLQRLNGPIAQCPACEKLAIAVSARVNKRGRYADGRYVDDRDVQAALKRKHKSHA